MASGRGGPGCVSFRREIYVPRGGPDGGDGGRGGHVIFKTSNRLHSLLDLKLKKKYKAQDGEPGRSQKRSGADGADLVLTVPPGTVIKNSDGVIIRDLGRDEEFIFLKGGQGGKGNPFYKTSVNQAPTVAQKGMPGEEATVRLELKLLADVGIIGFPNAGKSTLISHISSARPKVADYPFTTLIPNLGVVRYGEESSFIVADMPGLIKGAHKGVGLGTRFLRHIERTRCFVHVIDASGTSGRDPVQDYRDIHHELKMYDRAHEGAEGFRPLANRAEIVALNKVDVLNEGARKNLEKKFKKLNIETFLISAATGENLKNLIHRMGEMVFYGEKDEDKKDEKSATGKKGPKKERRASEKSGAKIKSKARAAGSSGKSKGDRKKKIKKGSKKVRHSKN